MCIARSFKNNHAIQIKVVQKVPVGGIFSIQHLFLLYVGFRIGPKHDWIGPKYDCFTQIVLNLS